MSALRVFVYKRCSSKKQDTSIAIQTDRLAPFVKQNGYKVIDTFTDDGHSGAIRQEKRVEFWAMLERLDEVDGIVCLNTSRFGRLDSIKAAPIKEQLRKAGVVLIMLDGGTVDFTKSTDRIVSGVKSEVDHQKLLDISDGSLSGKLDKVSKGIPCCGGQPPYGMVKIVVDPLGNTHTITRHDKFRIAKGWPSPTFAPGEAEEVEVIQWIFTTFYETEVSYNGLARMLNEKGIPSPSGGKWRNVTIRQMLTNLHYCGAAYIGRNVAGTYNRAGSNGDLDQPSYEQAPESNRTPEQQTVTWDSFEGLVSKELWQECYKKIEARKASGSKPKSTGRQYVLRGVLFCGHCGCALQGKYNKELREGRRVSYRCSNRPAPCPECNGSIFEADFLPGILTLVADAVQSIQQAGPPKKKKLDGKKALAKIDKAQALIRHKLKITTDDEFYIELQDDLRQLREERVELEKVVADVVMPSVAAEFTEWHSANRENLTHVRGKSIKAVRDESGKVYKVRGYMYKEVEKAALRDLLHKMGLRIRVFYTDSGEKGKRWILDRGKMEIDFAGVDTGSGHHGDNGKYKKAFRWLDLT